MSELTAAHIRELEATWSPPRGLTSFFTAADHKTIGIRFILTAFGFFALAGLAAAVMRLQLSRPENDLVGPDLYNQLFTMHGTTMMFLFAVPVWLGLGIYFVPLMIGTREIAFPRMNALAYWLYLFGGLLLWTSFFLNIGPDAGWFSYVPLAGPEFAPGKRVDVWAQLVNFTETSALLVAVQLVVTIFKQRAPGMSLNRMPIFVWAILITSLMIIFAMPSVVVATMYLALDRLVGTHFFNVTEGGDALVWQHLFWFFAHPEVYIIFIPALGIVSTVISVFTRRATFGHNAMILSMSSTAFIGFGVWVHHMFATGLPQLGQSFFTAASIMISVPTGIQFFCWIVTIWLGNPVWKTPFYFLIGFLLTFLIGGLSGVMLASIPIDLQAHDTFFVVAHLHYVLIGGAVFPLFSAVYYWFPKWTGRRLSEKLGKINFWLLFIGFNLTFFPMHQVGLQGMPRRVYTYLAETGWGTLNLIASIGAVVLAVSMIMFLANVALSLRKGEIAGDNPWDSHTLEWAASSPPPPYNFAHLPVVYTRDGLWKQPPDAAVVTGLATDKREILVTRLLDAEPDHRTEYPEPSIWPFITGVIIGGMFIGLMFTPWAAVVGSGLATVALIAWFWPKSAKAPSEEVLPELPHEAAGESA